MHHEVHQHVDKMHNPSTNIKARLLEQSGNINSKVDFAVDDVDDVQKSHNHASSLVTTIFRQNISKAADNHSTQDSPAIANIHESISSEVASADTHVNDEDDHILKATHPLGPKITLDESAETHLITPNITSNMMHLDIHRNSTFSVGHHTHVHDMITHTTIGTPTSTSSSSGISTGASTQNRSNVPHTHEDGTLFDEVLLNLTILSMSKSSPHTHHALNTSPSRTLHTSHIPSHIPSDSVHDPPYPLDDDDGGSMHHLVSIVECMRNLTRNGSVYGMNNANHTNESHTRVHTLPHNTTSNHTHTPTHAHTHITLPLTSPLATTYTPATMHPNT
ncbi:hypothetical protein EON63_19155, partial [archaeon]